MEMGRLWFICSCKMVMTSLEQIQYARLNACFVSEEIKRQVILIAFFSDVMNLIELKLVVNWV